MIKTLLLLIFFSFILNARMDFEKRGKWLNVLPFGVGQYQNYQETKALILFSSETILLGTALSTAFISQGKEANGKLRSVELYSFIAFLSIYFYGVYDAFKNYDDAETEIIKQMEKKVSLQPEFRKNFIGMEMVMRF